MDFNVHLFFHSVPDGTLAALAQRIEHMDHTLTDLVTQVTAQTGTVASMSAFIAGLEAQIKAILGGTLTPEMQAQVNAIFTDMNTNTQAIADAIDSDPNTPPVFPPVAVGGTDAGAAPDTVGAAPLMGTPTSTNQQNSSLSPAQQADLAQQSQAAAAGSPSKPAAADSAQAEHVVAGMTTENLKAVAPATRKS